MEKILPLQPKPYADSYPFVANPLSILFAQSDDAYPWFMYQLTQLMLKKTGSNIEYAFNWWFRQNTVDKESIFCEHAIKIPRFCINKDTPFITELIKQYINNNYYCVCDFNEFYVNDRASFSKYYYKHENMIYGFSDNTKSFYLIGYNGKNFYSASVLNYDNFCDSFRTLDLDTPEILFFKVNDKFSYSYNMDIFLNDLNDYINGRGSDDQYVFGINIYDQFINQIKGSVDLRDFYLLHEHKKLMLMKIEFAYNYLKNQYKEKIIAGCNELCRLTEININLSIKYKMAPSGKTLHIISNNLNTIKNIEAETLEMFLTEASKQCFA